MAVDTGILEPVGSPEIKLVPQEGETRGAIRRAACQAARALDARRSPSREDLERLGSEVLADLGLPLGYLGFAMVAVDNAFWREAFRAVPFDRRLLLLPKCLSRVDACEASFDSVGLHCAGCGACAIRDLKARAEALGYQVVVAEGTSSVLMKVLEGEADALLGVACLDSLEKSFARVADMGIPHAAVPLLSDGCVETTAELDEVVALLGAQGGPAPERPHTYVPLLREGIRLFSPRELDALLAPYLTPGDAGASGMLAATDALALGWLRKGGKRFRPFFTLAAYAVARSGTEALAPDAELAGLFPPAVCRLAVAIEVLHKASLVHDDIEDDDATRYGEPALHRAHGTGPALNVGDFLIGLGYRLVAGTVEDLGAACAADIVGYLSAAQLELCRGQGADLLWKEHRGEPPSPQDILAVYALKTAPAFEVALAAGLRAAGVPFDAGVLKRFCLYLGEGYQVLNDLEEWEPHAAEEARDALAGRPTLLRALALGAGGTEARQLLACVSTAGNPRQAAVEVRELYTRTRAFERAEHLLARLRERALAQAEEMATPALRELLAFLVRVTLADRGLPGR